jgi:hypothetical protein
MAQIPSITIPDADLAADTLPAMYDRQIADWIKRNLNTLSTSKDDKAIATAATGLVDGYNRYESAGYRAAYGKGLSALGTPVLAKAGGYALVQLSLALSQVPEMTMLDCLGAMIHHPSPATRYLGWKCYLNGGLRAKMLSQGAKQTTAMMDLLAKRAKEETSSAAFGPMLDMLRIPPASGGPADDANVKAAQKRAWEILQQIWPALCLHTMSGDPEIARACRQGIITLDYFSQILEPKEKAKLPQMVVNMMYSAAKAYDDAGAEGIVANINEQLARDCETLLATLSGGENKGLVAKALGKGSAADRRTDVPMAVLDWVKELKPKGVVEPKIETIAGAAGGAGATTTAPASK